ncbi:VTC domain-containing protein [Microdochium trichocladiopsis]|uniref:VTC domain-containing protein n=1 Tax=Microdochium trichocladiopsis TaxID=1682393 RepID=A0A9P9BWF4_9PEZI|nr:VTC domain-containing protein [Microdochium trichocladiopsis]KAH7040545.1 VTC domain-containing protein [Microdochium trichocladiopsis]
MRFGKTLQQSIHPPWKEHYLDYSKLKRLLRDDARGDDDDKAWTEDDEKRFSSELLNVELDKVAQFQAKTIAALEQQAEDAFSKLRELAPSSPSQKSDITTGRLKELRKELDSITNELKELKRYASTNYTGFLKIAKKHDRRRGDRYKIRPMIRVSLSQHGFNSEASYTPLLNKLSMMYFVVNQHLDESEQQAQPVDLRMPEEVRHGERYTAHKFWVHPDNLLEVKTAVLRHLPALHYSQQDAKQLDGGEDLATTSIYFDNHQFELYSQKVERQFNAASLRLRWYGQLADKPDIVIEKKMVHENGSSEEKRFKIKDKWIMPLITGEYKMERTIQKMERQGQPAESIKEFKDTVEEIQAFIQEFKLEPVMRANYTRTAFQKPADDRVRILIDNDTAFIREDTLNQDRPCREPDDWHRRDIDSAQMTFPFRNMNQSEVSRFPFALMEIKIREDEGKRRPGWIEDLMASHLVHAAPTFSKFVHGVASLFEDYVNNLPFWLGDLETDIRKDPQAAHDKEEQRKAQQAETEQVVGSFLGKSAKRSSYKPSASSPVARSYLSERLAAEPAVSDSRTLDGGAGDDETDEAEETETRGGYGTLTNIFPTFSLSRYARAKRQQAQLPEGVAKPTYLIKNAGPLQVEPKVWLANERTFLKWQHICVLLGSLAVGLYTAAGENFVAECMGIAYIIIAILAGVWGFSMFKVRQQMIVERSGKDFDNMIGPLAVSIALMIALILNFVLALNQALNAPDEPSQPVTPNVTLGYVGEL